MTIPSQAPAHLVVRRPKPHLDTRPTAERSGDEATLLGREEAYARAKVLHGDARCVVAGGRVPAEGVDDGLPQHLASNAALGQLAARAPRAATCSAMGSMEHTSTQRPEASAGSEPCTATQVSVHGWTENQRKAAAGST